jgi:hypothetical protein
MQFRTGPEHHRRARSRWTVSEPAASAVQTAG